MDPLSRRLKLALVLTLQLLIFVDNDDMTISFVRMAGFYGRRNWAGAASSPLAGTKIRTPWVSPGNLSSAGRRYIPSIFDEHGNEVLTKLLDVGACSLADLDSTSISYVPPLDGTSPDSDNTLCQDFFGMRFVLFDLKLVNIDSVDSLSGSFTAQFQLVFHWTEGWEALWNETGNDVFAYGGDEIKTADNATLCGFDCDTTSASKTRCCDRMWVPPLQVPSCKVNDVQSVTPTPYVMTEYFDNKSSYWSSPRTETVNYTQYSARRTWYVGLDVTCPFTPEFRNFPFDYQFLTLDIVNPYASRTWLQLNKGFLEANIVDSISGIDLSPDDKIDGWRIEDLIVSSACGTQQTWKPTFLTQVYLLQILGDHYKSQNDTITATLHDLKCAGMENFISEKASLSNPSNDQPYQDTMNAYRQRLNATIAQYKKCTSESMVDFKWNTSLEKSAPMTQVSQFNYSDSANMNRSFSFLDLQYSNRTVHGIDFTCLIEAVANLTTPGVRINIIIQRFKKYYIVKLFLPTCACVAFSFTAFALSVDKLLDRLTVIVPSAIALSALQGFVVATDIPAVAYMAPTTYIILLSYAIQLLIALECICLKALIRIYPKLHNQKSTSTGHLSNKSSHLAQHNENVDALDPQFDQKTRIAETQQSCETKEIQMVQTDRSHLQDQATQETQGSKLTAAIKIDLICCALLLTIYIIFLTMLARIPLQNARNEKENILRSARYQSVWNSS